MTASTAFAARVAVLVPKLDSDAQTSEGKRNKFHDSLTAGIADGAQAGTTVIPASEVRKTLAGKPELLSCTQSGCASVAAAQLQADRVVTSELQVRETVGGAAYTIKVSVYDATGATTGITANERCGNIGDGCNVKRAYEALTRATASIAAKTMEMKPTETAPTPAPVTPAPEMQLKDPTETTPSALQRPHPAASMPPQKRSPVSPRVLITPAIATAGSLRPPSADCLSPARFRFSTSPARKAPPTAAPTSRPSSALRSTKATLPLRWGCWWAAGWPVRPRLRCCST
jgi:hypothetical protein